MSRSTSLEEAQMNKEIGKRVRARRRLLGMTQDDLAKKVGIRFQQIQKYESGANRLTFTRAIQVAEALDMNVRDLAGESVKDRPELSQDILDRPYVARTARAVAKMPERMALRTANLAEASVDALSGQEEASELEGAAA